MPRRWAWIWLAALLFAACEPEATPLPVDIVPTTSQATVAAAPQTIRYGIDTAALRVMPEDEYALIAENAEIDAVSQPFDPAAISAQYDVLIALGDLPDGERTSTPVTLTLALNATLPPLDDPEIAAVVRDAVDSAQFATALNISGAQALPHESQPPQALRTTLANLGLPDGFDLSLAVMAVPGTEALSSQLAAIGVDIRVTEFAPGEAPDASRYHLLLTAGSAQELLPGAGADTVIALATIPISYRAADGLTIEFTPGGLPLARR